MQHSHKQAGVECVLVVDDDVVTCNYLSLLLQRWGYEVVAVYDLPSARKALSENIFCLALIDLQYPDEDASGFDLIDQVRAEQPGCGVMIITSDHTAETAVEAIRLRVDDYFLKPINTEDLLSAIELHMSISGGSSDEAPDESAAGPPNLTEREKSVLQMFHQGCSYKETGHVLGCSITTVQTHAKHIYRKMGVHSRAEAVHEGLRLHLIKI